MAVLPEQPRPVPGGVAVVPLHGDQLNPHFAGQPVLVFLKDNKPHAVVGLPLDISPGLHHLETASGPIPLHVLEKNYPTQHVRIRDRAKVDLSPSDQARVMQEHAEIGRLKRHFSSTSAPRLDFTPPADGPISGLFGARRVFNGKPRAPHVGLDFKVPVGAPIRAASSGTVLAVADYFFNGQTVVIDHGQGLITLYCHLNRIDVAAGQQVKRGDPLGSAGATGRASGPHLHWSVVLNGAMVDPQLFLP